MENVKCKYGFKKAGDLLKPFFRRRELRVYYDNTRGWVYNFNYGSDRKVFSNQDEVKVRNQIIDYLVAEGMMILQKRIKST